MLAAAAIAVLGIAATGAQAAGFQNGSFELGTFVDIQGGGQNTDRLFDGATVITGWTVVAPNADVSWGISPDVFNINASDGSHYLDLTGYCDHECANSGYGGVSQTFDTVSGAKYIVTFDLGNSLQYNDILTGAGLAVSVGDQSNVSFLNLTTATNANGNTSSWATETLDFTAQGSSTTLLFAGNRGQSIIGLDNVSVGCVNDCIVTTGPGGVPEPASWALMMLGFGGLGAALRARRKGLLAAA
jgi:Protein of unknown function (DUF642)/PEP-CTERM motif